MPLSVEIYAVIYAASKTAPLGKWWIAEAKLGTATPSTMRSTPTANPMNQMPVIGNTHTDSLSKCSSRMWRYHKFLKIDIIISMFTSIYNIHTWNR